LGRNENIVFRINFQVVKGTLYPPLRIDRFEVEGCKAAGTGVPFPT
jgi:hypothetical protein